MGVSAVAWCAVACYRRCRARRAERNAAMPLNDLAEDESIPPVAPFAEGTYYHPAYAQGVVPTWAAQTGYPAQQVAYPPPHFYVAVPGQPGIVYPVAQQ